MAVKAPLERVAFTPKEFAAQFGKSETWGYRQIYAGNVKAITQYGRRLIPASEVDKILKTAAVFDGSPHTPVKTKSEICAVAPHLPNAWRSFLSARRQPNQPMNHQRVSSAVKRWLSSASERQAALARLSRRTK